MTTRRMWSAGLAAGAFAGVADGILIAAVDPSATGWVVVQSALFWLVAGGVVVAAASALPNVAHGVVVTVALNLPWYIAFGPGAGHPEHVPPLVVMSLVFGAGFGLVRGWALRGSRPRAT